MHTMLIILFIITLSLLVLVASITPRRPSLSQFELHRRKGVGSSDAADELTRMTVLDSILLFQKAMTALLLVLVALLSVITFGWGVGALVAVIVAVCYGRLAHVEMIHGIADRLYHPYDMVLVRLIHRHPTISRATCSTPNDERDMVPASREELEHLIDVSGHILTGNEKKLIKHGLAFSDKKVESIMIPRGVVDTIARSELLGPIVLDDLHRTGHSRFPVTDGDIDHIVGVLHLQELLQLNDKVSHTVEDMMEQRVYYISQERTLSHALAAFLKTHHHLFIVVNGYRETAGIITLEDVIEALIGRRIIDEFDVHDDLRAVAASTAHENNSSPQGINI